MFPPMNPLDYLRRQLRLEGKEIFDDSLLRQVEVVPDEEIPLLLIAQLADENLVAYFDEALSTELREPLQARLSNFTFPNVDTFSSFLQSRHISFEVGQYKTYIFPEQ